MYVRPPRECVLFSYNQYDTSYNAVHVSFTIYCYHFGGRACASIVETRFLELAMSLLDFSP